MSSDFDSLNTTDFNGTLLDRLLAQDPNTPHQCRKGTCHQCLVQAVDPDQVPKSAQKGLRPTAQKDGWLLACQCQQDLALVAEQWSAVPVIRVDYSADILRLQVDPGTLKARPGQWISVRLPAPETHPTEWISRPYSVIPMESKTLPESSPTEYWEFHIKILNDGVMSQAIKDIQVNDFIEVMNPRGFCTWDDSFNNTHLLCLGTGTGAAPLWAIMQQIQRERISVQSLTFVHGNRTDAEFYLRNEWIDFAKAWTAWTSAPLKRFEIQSRGAVDEPSKQEPIVQHTSLPNLPQLQREKLFGRIPDHINHFLIDPAQSTAFLCGHPDMVQLMRKTLFLKGLPSSRILADAFVKRGNPT
jgi:ferredoxin-NADP reductase/ferredoxin